MKLTGYVDSSTTVRLEADAEAKTVRLKLIPKPSSVRVESVPDGAKIYIDDEWSGKRTPYTFRTIKPGSHRIRIELADHELMARTVTVKPGADTVEEFRLKGNTGLLQISTQPSGATIYVDGKRVGKTTAGPGADVSDPYDISLGEGVHEVKISRRGHRTISGKVTIKRDTTVSRKIVLVREFIPDTLIETKDGSLWEGMLHPKSETGMIQIETKPGVIKKISPADIKSVRSILN